LGLAGSVGYTVYKYDGTTYAARSTSGVVAMGPMAYAALVSLPTTGCYCIQWDDGSAHYAYDTVSLPPVTVGGYAAGQDPATYVLATPANKLATDATGTVACNVTEVGGYPIPASTVNGALRVDVAYTNGIKFTNYDDVLAAVASSTQVTLGASEPADCSPLVGMMLYFLSGACAFQGRIIVAAAGRQVTLDKALVGIPAAGDQYLKEGYAGANVVSVDAVQVEPGVNLRQATSVMLAVQAGKVSGFTSSGSSNPVFLAPDGTTARLTGTVDPLGNRSVSTLNPPV
jgi:hypothetical protein